ncbi:MAG: DUF554 domain-containing protein [Eubacteriales bacterium]|nr:DUF554 domain-containing protein [Eubacteriales bacterium]
MLNGTFLDVAAIVIGGMIGVAAKSKLIPRSLQDKIMQAIAMCALLIGMVGMMDADNLLVCIISIVLGTIIGSLLSIEDRLSSKLTAVFSFLMKGNVSDRFMEGFISYSILSISGSMAIVGPISNCLEGDITTLAAKSVLDFVSTIIFGATFGISIPCTAVIVFLYQGTFALLAWGLSPIMTNALVNDMSAIGALLIFTMGLNMLKVSEIKIMNITPAIFLPIVLHQIVG